MPEYSIPDEIEKNDIITAKWLNGIRSTAIHGDGNAIAPLTKVDSPAGVHYGITPQHKLSWGIVKSDWGMQSKSDYDFYSSDYLEILPLDARGELQTSDRTIKVYFHNPYRINSQNPSDSIWRKSARAFQQFSVSDKISYIPFATSDSADYGMIMWPQHKFGFDSDYDPTIYSSDTLSDSYEISPYTHRANSDFWAIGEMCVDDSDYNLIKPWLSLKYEHFPMLVKISDSTAIAAADNGPKFDYPESSTTEWTYSGIQVEESIDGTDIVFDAKSDGLHIPILYNRIEYKNRDVDSNGTFTNGTVYSDINSSDFIGKLQPIQSDAVVSVKLFYDVGSLYGTFQAVNGITGKCK